DAGLAIGIRQASAVTHETARFREVNKRVDARDSIARGQGHDLVASSDEESISTDHDCVSASLSQARESCIDFVLATCCQFLASQPYNASCSFPLRHFGIGPRIVRIDDHRNGASLGQ